VAAVEVEVEAKVEEEAEVMATAAPHICPVSYYEKSVLPL
jgi:hypothetical protein